MGFECQLRSDNPGPVGKAVAAGGHEQAHRVHAVHAPD